MWWTNQELGDHDRYIKAVLNALPLCQTVEDYEALLPWNINLSEAKSDKVAKSVETRQ